MTKESIVFFLGAIVFVLPHVGVPESWKVYAFSAIGIVLMIVGYSLRRRAYIRSIEKEDGERDADSFTENVGSRSSEKSDSNT